jgi:transcriptional regulator with XRE-family HTH domain
MCQMTSIDFPNWLQKQLGERNWKPTDLAKRSRISDAAISRILRGERKADPDTLRTIAQSLKLPTETVFRAAGILPPKHEEDEWEERMNYKLSKIKDPAKRQMAEKTLEAFLDDPEPKLTTLKPKLKSG